MSKYAVDFDGVIVERVGVPTIKQPTEGLIMMPYAASSIEWMIKQGHEIYILTTHEPIKEVKEWMDKNCYRGLRVTNIKEPNTKAFIDDRAIRFTSWQDIRKLLE